MAKPLIAYFSREGKNYVDKRMRNLTIGNTEVISRKIQKLTGGDLLKIETISAYPDDYTQTIKITKEETRNNARQPLEALNQIPMTLFISASRSGGGQCRCLSFRSWRPGNAQRAASGI